MSCCFNSSVLSSVVVGVPVVVVVVIFDVVVVVVVVVVCACVGGLHVLHVATAARVSLFACLHKLMAKTSED